MTEQITIVLLGKKLEMAERRIRELTEELEDVRRFWDLKIFDGSGEIHD